MTIKIKYLLKWCVFCGLHVFYLFPIRKKNIYFISFQGKHVCCNPKYIYQYMQKKKLSYRFIWCSENKDGITDKNVTFVKQNSLRNLFYSLTSSVYITNNQVYDYIPFRKKQMIIETWHGGGVYKKDGFRDEVDYKYAVSSFLGMRKRQRVYCFISSSALFTKCGLKDFCLEENKFVPYGMPRNDLFFNQLEVRTIRNKVRQKYNVDDETMIVMYAPTFRGDACTAKFDFLLDIPKITLAVQKKFTKKVMFFMRGHHTFEMCGISIEKENTINVSDYPDMQELICAADVLITDYSSTLWDWSLTRKPAFIYAPDVDKYIQDRGFYFPIETWGFPVAISNEKLYNNILDFQEATIIKNIQKHQEDLGSYEDGHASERIVCDIITHVEEL